MRQLSIEKAVGNVTDDFSVGNFCASTVHAFRLKIPSITHQLPTEDTVVGKFPTKIRPFLVVTLLRTEYCTATAPCHCPVVAPPWRPTAEPPSRLAKVEGLTPLRLPEALPTSRSSPLRRCRRVPLVLCRWCAESDSSNPPLYYVLIRPTPIPIWDLCSVSCIDPCKPTPVFFSFLIQIIQWMNWKCHKHDRFLVLFFEFGFKQEGYS